MDSRVYYATVKRIDALTHHSLPIRYRVEKFVLDRVIGVDAAPPYDLIND